MAIVMLRNICIDVNGAYVPRWCLQVRNISRRDQVEKREDINLSGANRSKFANWLWNN